MTKYILNKKIFYTNLILCLLLVGSVLNSIGWNSLIIKTEILTCPENLSPPTPCTFRTPTGEIKILQIGETKRFNQFNQKQLNIANWGVWILIIISITTNHLIYNRKYPIKKELTKLIKKIKIIKID